MKNEMEEFWVELNEAYAKGNLDYIIQHASEDIRWNMVGDRILQGKKEFVDFLHEMKMEEGMETQIQKYVMDGKKAAVSGTLFMKDGKKYAFCDMYELNGDKNYLVKTMESFVIKIV
ncbi:nuclear transport factor 2 family protein [Pararhodonellum marinum]|uniref:nuclear transport factor 2 family protein n=1 Tax=Pararhodonellum marinum TaxID=2755358 RepID=UPI00188FE2A0|nr:nuclear transport factor 2 family protein [Pararhodonellum marinum]